MGDKGELTTAMLMIEVKFRDQFKNGANGQRVSLGGSIDGLHSKVACFPAPLSDVGAGDVRQTRHDGHGKDDEKL